MEMMDTTERDTIRTGLTGQDTTNKDMIERDLTRQGMIGMALIAKALTAKAAFIATEPIMGLMDSIYLG